jgi:hypothetical protein
MLFYNDYIIPRVISLAVRNRELDFFRRRVWWYPNRAGRSKMDEVNRGLRMTKKSLLAFFLAALGLTACGFDDHEVRQWTLPANHQSIDANPEKGVAFAFSEGLITVTLKAPPDFRSLQKGLPQSAFDQHSQRRLLEVEYDYRSESIETQAEFELQTSFVRLAAPLSTTDLDADTFYRALRIAWRRPLPKDDDPATELVTVNGRQWVHLDGTDSRFGGKASESYGTLIDPKTVFFVTGSYWENIRKNPAWLESRRALLRSIRDNVVVLTQ